MIALDIIFKRETNRIKNKNLLQKNTKIKKSNKPIHSISDNISNQ